MTGRLLLLVMSAISGVCMVLMPVVFAQNNATILLQNVRVIVGEGSVIEAASILIEDGLITAVGNSNDFIAAENVSRLDLDGKTVIPALIDAHAHLGYQSQSGWGAEFYSRENLIDNLQQYAYFGFGAVFSAGSDPEQLALELQQAQRNGEFEAARFQFSAGMAPPGQGPNNQFLVHALSVAEKTGMTILHGLSNPQQARAEVRRVATEGIPFIKIWVDDRGGTQQKLEPEIYRALIDEANANGISVFVHQQRAEDMPELLDAGVAGFLHGRIGTALDDEIAMHIKRADAFVIPNLGLGELRREAIGEDPFLSQILTSATANRLSAAAELRVVNPTRNSSNETALQRSFASLLRAEVDIVLGTDAGAIPDHPFGYSGHRELEIFVRLGMTPMRALIAATSEPAKRLGLDDMGQIKAGFSADLVILDANPLDDIRNTRSIYQVYLRGKLVDRGAFISNLAN